MELARADWIPERAGGDPRVPAPTISPAAPAVVALLPRAVADRVPAGEHDRHAVGGEPHEADRRRRAAEKNVDHPERRRPRRASSPRTWPSSASRVRAGSAIARRLRRSRRADQGRGHVHQGLRPRAARTSTSPSTSSGPTEEDPAYAARCRELVATLGREDEIRFVGPQPPARDLRRPRRGRADQLQRRPAARDPRGVRGRRARDRDRRRRLPRDDRGHRAGRTPRPERHRHARRRARRNRRRAGAAGARPRAPAPDGRGRPAHASTRLTGSGDDRRYRALYERLVASWPASAGSWSG